MAYQFSLSRYYVTPENDEKLEAFSDASGDSRQTLIMQYTRGWLGRNRVYYTQLAILDLRKREISASEWVQIVLGEGFKGLPPYKNPILEDEVSKDPLAHIILPDGVLEKQSNYFALTRQNYLLLRTAIHFDGSSATRFISKIIHEHLIRNWDSLYAAQVVAETSNDWLKGE
ncbi:transposase [Nostoc sp. B(2019)]|nr:transposase [Nostoc sp. B(2019)]